VQALAALAIFSRVSSRKDVISEEIARSCRFTYLVGYDVRVDDVDTAAVRRRDEFVRFVSELRAFFSSG
jgi:hypothetical protein